MKFISLLKNTPETNTISQILRSEKMAYKTEEDENRVPAHQSIKCGDIDINEVD
jgi:S-ribosylhomocysteine lyase LuxS involved in autoinducer biosynthesis